MRKCCTHSSSSRYLKPLRRTRWLCLSHLRNARGIPYATPPDSVNNPQDDPSKPQGGNPRPRKNIPNPRTIRINASGRMSNKARRSRVPDPPPQPPDPINDPTIATIARLFSSLPGIRQLTNPIPPGSELPESATKSPAYGDWASDIEVGDDWDYRPKEGSPAFRRRPDTRQRYPNTNTPRDSFLRPIADPIGVVDRLSWDREAREKRLSAEAALNRRESRAALVFAGLWLFLFPFGLGFFVSRGLAEPYILFIQENNPERLALTEEMKLEGARELRQEVLRMRLEANIGKAPPLTDDQMFHQLQHRALEFEHEKKEEIRVGIVNIMSDSVTLLTFLVTVFRHSEGRVALRNTIGRISQGMSQTGKAFILILTADILMGYHSEEGWTATIEILSEHYMIDVGEGPLAIFVSTVPVILDTAFKWWLFKGLNRIDPSASVTLSEIDR